MKQLLKRLAIHCVGYPRFLRVVHRVRTWQENWHPGEFTALRALVRPGSVVLDVGANIGYTARCLAETAGSKVIAIEPDEDNVACLRAMLSDLGNVVVQQVAIGSRDGSGTLNVPVVAGVKQHALGRMADVAGQTVVRSVDSLRGELGPIGMLKIDVEGFESEVLAGMQETLRADRPIVHVEICGEPSQRAYATAMAALQYTAMRWQRDRFVPADVDRDGNFLFVPAAR